MEYESENCHTLPYKNQEIEARYNLRPPSLIESEYESDSDMEADATAGAILNYQPDTAPGTVKHAPGRAILEHETGSVTLRQNSDIIRRRHVLNSNPGSKSTTIDAEACANSETD